MSEAHDSRYGAGSCNNAPEEQRRLPVAVRSGDVPISRRYRYRLGDAVLGGWGRRRVGRSVDGRARSGPPGSVLVTDIDTTLLVGCDEPNIEVRVHDIASDPLDAGSFELIHARLVSEHLSTRLAVVEKLVAVLCPGSSSRISTFRLAVSPRGATAVRATRGGRDLSSGDSLVLTSIATAWDAEFGLDPLISLTNAGLDHVSGEAPIPAITAGSPQLGVQNAGVAASRARCRCPLVSSRSLI